MGRSSRLFTISQQWWSAFDPHIMHACHMFHACFIVYHRPLQDGLDQQAEPEYVQVLKQRHDVLAELGGFKLLEGDVLPDAPDDSMWHIKVALGKEHRTVISKYSKSAEDLQQATATFARAMAAIPEGDLPFTEFASLQSWVGLLVEMEKLKTAPSLDMLSILEASWQNYRALYVAFGVAYKKSVKILKDSLANQVRTAEKKKVEEMAVRDKHLISARVHSEKLRQDRVKNIFAAQDTAINWFPLKEFKPGEHFAARYEKKEDFLRALEHNAIDFSKPFHIQEHGALKEMLADQAATGAKACVGRFKYYMRKQGQMTNVNEGRVWAPLCGTQVIPGLQDLAQEIVDFRPLGGKLGSIAQYMDSMWIHGMREDKLCSSHTPQFVGLLVLCASGRQDVIATPFKTLADHIPAVVASDVEDFHNTMQDWVREYIPNLHRPQPKTDA